MDDLQVHCLKCDNIYDEKKELVKICPYCGNSDMMKTVYLVGEEND